MSEQSFTKNNHDKTNENCTALSSKGISAYLENDVVVNCFEVIDSTNNEAKKNAHTLLSPTLFVANEQTAGRGRLGRSFFSPVNTGLYMSLYIPCDSDTSDIVCMTTATAVCVTDALLELYSIDSKIKWVNDVYLNDKKICGILCEAVNNQKTNAVCGIIIGIGINLSTTDFPQELSSIAGAVGVTADRNELCAKITDNIINTHKNIKAREFIKVYKERCMVLGKEIAYTKDGETKTATAIDIDRNGALVIKSGDKTQTLSTGEITVRLNA